MSTSSVFTFGLNHISAPLSIRERVAFPLEQLKPALEGLRTTFGQQIHEATILSTCNRTEIYCAAKPSAREYIPKWLADFSQLQNNSLLPHLYELEHDKAVRHAFRVASGLDSMVLGEPQILGQLKSAVRIADDAGALGTVLHQLFQRTFSVAKEVRTQTAIGAESVSMAAASVRLAQRVFGDLSTVKVLCIGAGEMIDLCATHMSAQNPLEMVVANRTIERAEQLAQRVNAQTMKLSELPDRLDEFDVIISCTASSLPILGLGLVERAAKKRRHKPIVMVDLAVPRDIEPEVSRLSDVYLYTVDDLGEMTQSAANSRQAAVIQAEAIIDTRVQHFIHWMDNRALIPTINAIQDQAQTINQIELERAQEALARGEDPQAVIESLTRRLSQKYLHGTLSTLNRSSAEEREVLTHLAPRLFNTRHHSPHHH